MKDPQIEIPEEYECCQCGISSIDEEDLKTDLESGQDLDQLTCEECYDQIDALMEDD